MAGMAVRPERLRGRAWGVERLAPLPARARGWPAAPCSGAGVRLAGGALQCAACSLCKTVTSGCWAYAGCQAAQQSRDLFEEIQDR